MNINDEHLIGNNTQIKNEQFKKTIKPTKIGDLNN